MAFFRAFPIRGDVELTADGRDFQSVTGRTKIAQQIRVRAQIFKASWRYDRNVGVPYFQEILVAGANTELVRRRFYELIMGTTGVLAVTSLTIVFDGPTETIQVRFTCVTNAGESITDMLDFVAGN